MWNNLWSYSWNISQISNHIDKDIDAVEKDGLVDELVVIMEKHRVAVERWEAYCRNSNLGIPSTNTNTKGNTHTDTKAITSTAKSLFGVDLSDVAWVCGCWKNLWSHLNEFWFVLCSRFVDLAYFFMNFWINHHGTSNFCFMYYFAQYLFSKDQVVI